MSATTHTDLLDTFCQVRPWTPEVHPALVAAAAADQHTVILPTHVVTKAGEIVGYGSLRPMVLCNVWVDSRKVRSRESLCLLNLAENLAVGLTGQHTVLMPCAEASPFHPLIERMGYARLGATTLNLKTVR